MEVVFSQLKQPQVHVGDGIEGATGQQNHFSPVRIFHGHSSEHGAKWRMLVPGTSPCRKGHEEGLVVLIELPISRRGNFKIKLKAVFFFRQPGL